MEKEEEDQQKKKDFVLGQRRRMETLMREDAPIIDLLNELTVQLKITEEENFPKEHPLIRYAIHSGVLVITNNLIRKLEKGDRAGTKEEIEFIYGIDREHNEECGEITKMFVKCADIELGKMDLDSDEAWELLDFRKGAVASMDSSEKKSTLMSAEYKKMQERYRELEKHHKNRKKPK